LVANSLWLRESVEADARLTDADDAVAPYFDARVCGDSFPKAASESSTDGHLRRRGLFETPRQISNRKPAASKTRLAGSPNLPSHKFDSRLRSTCGWGVRAAPRASFDDRGSSESRQHPIVVCPRLDGFTAAFRNCTCCGRKCARADRTR